MCAEAIADEHQHVVNVAGRQLMCVCRGCYLLFTDTHAAAALPGGPRPLSGLPGLRAGPPRVGGAADPGRPGVLLPQLGAGQDRRVLSRAGGRHRIRAGPRRVERHPRRRPAGGHARRRRRSAAGAGARRRNRRRRKAIWCPSTPATSSSAGCGCCGAASTAASRCASSSTTSSISSTARSKVVTPR